ncbi:hypothetical protein VPH35_103352 [Triticum aestivum]
MAAVTFEEEVSRLAAGAAAVSPALVRTAVGALARSSAARPLPMPCKDDVDGRVRRWPLIWDAAVAFFHLAAFVGLIGLVLLICGRFQEVSYLLRTAAVLCKLLLTVLFSIRAAVALWRMNPQQPAAVAVAVV